MIITCRAGQRVDGLTIAVPSLGIYSIKNQSQACKLHKGFCSILRQLQVSQIKKTVGHFGSITHLE